MLMLDRRYGHRVPLETYLNTYVEDRPGRAFTVNVSETGLYLNTVRHGPLTRRTPVGLEFTLPGLGDVIWAAGEMCYGALDDYFCGTGVRFLAMAQRHERMLADYLARARHQRLFRGARLD
jgi:hypothetical protein